MPWTSARALLAMLLFADEHRERERHADRDPDAREQLLHRMRAHPLAVVVDQSAQRCNPTHPPEARTAGRSLRTRQPSSSRSTRSTSASIRSSCVTMTTAAPCS